MEWIDADILELQQQMENGTLSSKALTLAYLKRIQAFDDQICSIAELNPDAISIAEALDRERVLHGPRGPMHGIPVLLKDNISTGDKMHTTAGSVALSDNFASHDAPVVQALRRAGAVILGKTNLSEFARYIAMKFPDGYSSRGGQVKNPYGAHLSVSGSSSGSAAAVSSSFCAVAVGTETAGSISCPSMHNGICGLKPTVGLVSRSGIIPICNQDTAGPMGRTVTDCAILLGAMTTAEEPEDPATHCTAHLIHLDYTQFLKPDGLRGMRIGVNRVRCEPELFPGDCEAIFEQALESMRQAGAELVECDIPYTGLEGGILSQATLLYEFQAALDAYLAHYATGQCRRLADIIAYNQAHADIALRYGQDLLIAAQFETSGRLLESAYWDRKFEAIEQGQINGIDRALLEKGLDVIVCAGYSNLPPITGYPVMVVPMGISETGLPVGLSFYAGAFQEPKILQAAYGYEQCTHHRTPPVLKPVSSEVMQRTD